MQERERPPSCHPGPGGKEPSSPQSWELGLGLQARAHVGSPGLVTSYDFWHLLCLKTGITSASSRGIQGESSGQLALLLPCCCPACLELRPLVGWFLQKSGVGGREDSERDVAVIQGCGLGAGRCPALGGLCAARWEAGVMLATPGSLLHSWASLHLHPGLAHSEAETAPWIWADGRRDSIEREASLLPTARW